MRKYSKFIAAIVTPLVGALVMWISTQFGVDLSGVSDTLITIILAALTAAGVYIAPANSE